MNLDDKSTIIEADEFLRNAGYLGDFQKNALIINTLCAVDKAKNVSMDIDQQKMTIGVTIYLSRFHLIFANKKKIISILRQLYHDYIPAYEVEVRFAHYKKEKE